VPLPLINSGVSARIVQWENLRYDADRVTRGWNRYQFEINVEREWNAVKYSSCTGIFIVHGFVNQPAFQAKYRIVSG
jgi:hypothetical protein